MSDATALNFGPDELRCLATLDSHGVEYLLVGGYAVRYHGVMRPAKDVDVLVKNDSANSARVCAALIAIIGTAHPNLTPDKIIGQKRQINFEVWGYAFEVLTAADGIDFSEAYDHRTVAQLPTLDVPVIERSALIVMKRNAGRPQDLEDVHALNSHHGDTIA